MSEALTQPDSDPTVDLTMVLRQSDRQRFYDAKHEAMERVGMGELSNWQFLSLLLDVYDLHLEDGDCDG